MDRNNYNYNNISNYNNNLEKIRETYKNHNTKWNKEDEDKIFNIIKNKIIIDDTIVHKFGRTYNAIMCCVLKHLFIIYDKNRDDELIENGLYSINMDKETFISRYKKNESDKEMKKQTTYNKNDTDNNIKITTIIDDKMEEINRKLDLIIKKKKIDERMEEMNRKLDLIIKIKTIDERMEDMSKKLDLIIKRLNNLEIE